MRKFNLAQLKHIQEQVILFMFDVQLVITEIMKKKFYFRKILKVPAERLLNETELDDLTEETIQKLNRRNSKV